MYTKVYPKVSGLATWRKNCKWCSYCFKPIFHYRLSPETFGYNLIALNRSVKLSIYMYKDQSVNKRTTMKIFENLV